MWLGITIFLVLLTIADYFIPDIIPIIDEVLLTAASIYSFTKLIKK